MIQFVSGVSNDLNSRKIFKGIIVYILELLGTIVYFLVTWLCSLSPIPYDTIIIPIVFSLPFFISQCYRSRRYNQKWINVVLPYWIAVCCSLYFNILNPTEMYIHIVFVSTSCFFVPRILSYVTLSSIDIE